MKTDDSELNAIFSNGQKGSEENFTGNAFNIGLVDAESTYITAVGNVYFEPGARSNWHLHPARQILIITDGIGYHQIEGQPIETIKKGDVIKCPLIRGTGMEPVLSWFTATQYRERNC